MRVIWLLVVFVMFPSFMNAQNFEPPATKIPDSSTLAKIEELSKKLSKASDEALNKLPPKHHADLLIYSKAVEWILRHQEYYVADIGKQILSAIDHGLRRCESANDGKTPWLQMSGKSVVRAYRSRIDGSIQPYAVWYPAEYLDKPKPRRIDIMLHGRDSALTEVKFINSFASKNTPKDRDAIQIEIYGRGNNAYRWAGEEDVFEALADFVLIEEALGRSKYFDLRRVVLRGFSMGGAGTWHIGLRHPDKFIALQPGAGFTTTHGYIANLSKMLPSPQEELLTIYDAVNYAPNVANVPVVAYSGEIDKQRQAAVNIETQLEKLGLSNRMTHIVAPGLEHKFPPEWQKKVESLIVEFAGEGKARPHVPETVDFTTFTLKNSECDWVRIEGMENHYQPATLNGSWKSKQVRVSTKNVRRLTLTNLDPKFFGFPTEVEIDGSKIATQIAEDKPSRSRTFVRQEKSWKLELDAHGLEKIPGLQGPIDDVFTHAFICVVGTGKPTNQNMHDAAMAQLERFRKEWDKNFRGRLRIIDDSKLTPEISRGKSLILFGDPGSNRIINELLPELQVVWTNEKIAISRQVHDAKTHLPMLARPLPGSKEKLYVVINSGHTFHQADFNGTNALLYPRLGDFAIVKPMPTEKEKAAFEVIENGLYDEFWKVPK